MMIGHAVRRMAGCFAVRHAQAAELDDFLWFVALSIGAFLEPLCSRAFGHASRNFGSAST